MLPYLIFSAGVLANILSCIIPGFKRSDWLSILLATGAGLYVFIKAAGEGGSSSEFSFLASIATFSVIISFLFKDRVLQTVTESKLLLYLLVATYLTTTVLLPYTPFAPYILAVCVLLTAVVAGLNFSSLRLRNSLQTFFTVLFICANTIVIFSFFKLVYLSYFICTSCSLDTLQISHVGMFAAGFMFFTLAGNIAFILNFIPIPLSKHETVSERIVNIRKHAEHLERKYVDHDSHPFVVTGVIALAALLVYNGFARFMPEELLVTIVLLGGSVLTTPQKPIVLQANK